MFLTDSLSGLSATFSPRKKTRAVIEQVLALPNTDPLKLDIGLYSALNHAIRSGSLAAVKRIAAIPGMLDVSKDGLLTAARKGFIEGIIYLRQLGFDPNKETHPGKTVFDDECTWDRSAVEAIRKALTDPPPLPEPVQTLRRLSL